ncbi:MAG: glutamate--tRNA ligase [Terriglobia bacterium]
MPEVRVRFAPSPTGYVHVGNARTALFNWLFARHCEGSFVLRIEDTDVERSEERYEQSLIEALKWFGLDWDEGPDKGGPFAPYQQSERKELYARHARRLIESEQAYYCFCTPEQLETEREEALRAGGQPRYSGRCRALPFEDSARRVAAGEPAAIRLKIPDGSFSWDDMVHGPTTFEANVIGDPILVRSDGNPAYNYAVVIDDHMMEITHVLRGDDHISNTPRQLAVYRALGWQPPAFGHLSTILGPDRARLSKRHGAASLETLREAGILPEALRNYLALLGWSPGDGKTEILGGDELRQQFSLDHITRAPAVFDSEKLNWLNRHYLKAAAPARLAELSARFFAQAGYLPEAPSPTVLKWLERVIEAVLKNVDTLSQLPGAARLIFEYDLARVPGDPETRDAIEAPAAREVLAAFLPKALEAGEMSYERFRGIMRAVQKETGKKGRELFHPVRVALTGVPSGPELEKLIPIFEEGAKLDLTRPVMSCAQRLREFQKFL